MESVFNLEATFLTSSLKYFQNLLHDNYSLKRCSVQWKLSLFLFIIIDLMLVTVPWVLQTLPEEWSICQDVELVESKIDNHPLHWCIFLIMYKNWIEFSQLIVNCSIQRTSDLHDQFFILFGINKIWLMYGNWREMNWGRFSK